MKISKINLMVALAMPVLLFTSCLKDQDDKFDESSATRMQNYLDNTQQVLMSAENGWVLDYYPDVNQQYGGYTYLLKFSKTEATIISELSSTGASSTSLYTMKTDMGPVISFDTYNEEMHYFATPNSDEYQAKGGDFEFVIDSVGTDKIKLHGKRSQNVMYMRRLTDTPAQYYQDVKAMQDNFYVAYAAGQVGGQDVKFDFDPDNRQVEITTGGDTLTTAYTYAADGVRLYRPFTVGKTSVDALTLNTSAMTMTAAGTQLSTVALDPSIVVNLVGNITHNDDAFSSSFTIPYADQFDISYAGSSWLYVEINGSTVSVSADENTTGNMRAADIIITSKADPTLSAAVPVHQVEIVDMLGNYAIYYYNYNGELKQTTGTMAFYRNGLRLTMTYGRNTTMRFLMNYDDESAAMTMSSGQQIGTYSNAYYLIPLFFFGDGSYYTGLSTNYAAQFRLQYDKQMGMYAQMGSLLYDGEDTGFFVDEMGIAAFTKNSPVDFSSESGYQGLLDIIYGFTIVKNNSILQAPALDSADLLKIIPAAPTKLRDTSKILK